MKCLFKHLVSAFAVCFAAALLLCSCGDPHDIKLESYDITDISLNGLRGVNATLALEINNPSVKLKVSDIEGLVRRDGVVLANFAAEPFTIKRKSTRTYPLECMMNLDKDATLLDLLNTVKNFKTSDITVDISAVVSHGPVKKTVERQGVPIKKFLNK